MWGPSEALLEIPLDDLVMYEKCGDGAFGTVHRALWRSQDLIVAVKHLRALEEEAKVLNVISHKNVVRFYGVVTKDNIHGCCLVTEYAPEGSLYAYLRNPANKLDFKRIVNWATEIARGVHYLHFDAPVKVIHRDLKSKNVVLSADWTCKLCDFGASRFSLNTTNATLAGTFPWMAPEAMSDNVVSESTDVWSYGVVLWELLTKEIPFSGFQGGQLLWLIGYKKERLTIPTTCPQGFKLLLEMCWKIDPKMRPNLKRILSLLQGLLEDVSLPELTNSFLDHKMVWKKEIQVSLDQLKKAELAISNKEQELMEREMRLKQREKLVKQFNVVKLDDYDVATWRDVEVYQWVLQLRRAGHTADLAQYAELFLAHHITGRRMLNLQEKQLKEMGITSVGHSMDLLHEIEVLKAHNFRLRNFPPLAAKNTESVAASSLVTKETASVVLLFGHFLRKGHTDQKTKWKMFAEIEQDDDDDASVINLVKAVTFICKVPDFGTFTLTQPPFHMNSWCRGVSSDMTVECVVTYEPIVEKPKSTHVLYQVDGRSPNSNSNQHSVVLTLKKPTRASPEEEDIPPPSLASMQLSPMPILTSSPSKTNMPDAWTRNLCSVELPAPRSPSKTDLWSNVVSGRCPSISKPIPGTTDFINDFPTLSYSKALGRKCSISPTNGPNPPNTCSGCNCNKPSFAIGSDSISSSSSNVHNSDSLLSTASINPNSALSNQYHITETQSINNKLSPSISKEVFKKPGPSSAGVRENEYSSGGRKRITFEEGENKQMDRQLSRQTRSEPGKVNRNNLSTSNYQRALSGGHKVYIGGGQLQGNRQEREDYGRGDNRQGRGNSFFHQRQGGNTNQRKSNQSNSREEKGKFHKGEGGYEKRQNHGNYADGYVNAGRDQSRRGSKSDRTGKKWNNKQNLQLKVDNCNNNSSNNTADENDWTTVHKKHY